MLKKDLLGMVLTNLKRMKLRAILTTLGVVIGTAAVVTMVSLGVGMQKSAMGTFESSFGELTQVQVLPAGTLTPFGATEKIELKKEVKLNDRAVKKLRDLNGVIAVMPIVQVNAVSVIFGKYTTTLPMVLGVEPKEVEKFGFEVAEGKGFDKRKSALVGAKIPETFTRSFGGQPAPRQDMVGGEILLEVSKFGAVTEGLVTVALKTEGTKKYKFMVSGILREKGFENDYSIFIPLKDADEINKKIEKVPARKREYSKVLLKVDSPQNVSAVEEGVKEMGYEVFSLKEMLRGMRTFFLIIQAVLGGIASIALLVASLGIVNTMTMAIYERTREIGVMKAIGASRRDIIQIFLTESGVIGFLGGVFGALFGYIGGQVINLAIKFYSMQSAQGQGIPPDFSIIHTPIWLMVFAVIFATGVGLLAGVYPSLRAADLSPLGALRHE